MVDVIIPPTMSVAVGFIMSDPIPSPKGLWEECRRAPRAAYAASMGMTWPKGAWRVSVDAQRTG
jgi:hypothetical protein